MGYTNKTSHYDLPQWIAGDKPSWLGDVNTAMLNIDTAIASADASATAAESSAAAANAQVQAQEAKITKNTTDIQTLTESLADTQGEVNNVKTTAEGALPKSGGTMTGNLILNGVPTSDLQAATKSYVDSFVPTYIKAVANPSESLTVSGYINSAICSCTINGSAGVSQNVAMATFTGNPWGLATSDEKTVGVGFARNTTSSDAIQFNIKLKYDGTNTIIYQSDLPMTGEYVFIGMVAGVNQ